MHERVGIILAGGLGTRLFPLTQTISKQLLPVYDKPMIYYPLSVLMLAHIRNILIISTARDLKVLEEFLGSGEQFGIKLSYKEQANPGGIAEAFLIGEEFIAGRPSCLILGDNFFYGTSLVDKLRAVNADAEGATIFAYHVHDPQRYGIVEFDKSFKVLSIEEKPQRPRSSYAIPGLYFYDSNATAYCRSLTPSKRGELEITDLNNRYFKEGKLKLSVFGRGTTWLDMGTPESLIDASAFVRTIEQRQSLRICCPEEIAFRQKWIDQNAMEQLIRSYPAGAEYTAYLRQTLQHSDMF